MKKLRMILVVCFLAAFLGPLPANAGSPDPQLHKTQSLLNDLGYHPGPADGMMGKKTKHAIIQFQRDHGLPETGTPDSRTMELMQQKPSQKKTQAASPAKAKYDKNLHEAQGYLRKLGYGPGPADGMMGMKTQNAIKKFQRDRGLPETGALDDSTLNTIRNQAGQKNQPGPKQNRSGEKESKPQPKG